METHQGVKDEGSLPVIWDREYSELPEFRPQDSGCPESLFGPQQSAKASGLHTGSQLRRGRSTAWGVPGSPRTGLAPGDAHDAALFKITCPKRICH